jgi:hypothetical protein
MPPDPPLPPLRQWHVQYRDGVTHHVSTHPTPEAAIEAACRLIDQGHEVYGIGTGNPTDTIGPPDIARIYATWKAVNGPRSARGRRRPPPA